jgi:hypothetical protein
MVLSMILFVKRFRFVVEILHTSGTVRVMHRMNSTFVFRYCRCRVTRKTKEGDVLVCPDIVCDNVKDAEHLASTLALYRLCPGQVSE